MNKCLGTSCFVPADVTPLVSQPATEVSAPRAGVSPFWSLTPKPFKSLSGSTKPVAGHLPRGAALCCAALKLTRPCSSSAVFAKELYSTTGLADALYRRTRYSMTGLLIIILVPVPTSSVTSFPHHHYIYVTPLSLLVAALTTALPSAPAPPPPLRARAPAE